MNFACTSRSNDKNEWIGEMRSHALQPRAIGRDLHFAETEVYEYN